MTERCAVCGSPTRSHQINGRSVCHACFTEKTERELIEAAGGEVRDDLTAGTRLECGACGQPRTPREAASRERGVYTGSTDLDELPVSVVVMCPRWGETDRYYTTEEAIAAVCRGLDGGVNRGE